MNTLKKLFSLCLAVMLVLSLAVPAMAATDTTYTITLLDPADGHEYEAYQIFAGAYSEGVLSSVEWGKNFNTAKAADFIAALLADENLGPAFSGLTATSTAADVAKKLADQKLTHDAMLTQYFADLLHAGALNEGTNKYEYTYLLNTEVSDHKAAALQQSTVATNGKYSYTCTVPAGYYLIKDKDNSLHLEHDFYTRLLLQVVGAVTISPKGAVPSVKKYVNDQIGGTYTQASDMTMHGQVYFKLEGTLPDNYDKYEQYTYSFVDTMPVGLDFVQNEIQHDMVANNGFSDDIVGAQGIVECYIQHNNNTITYLPIGIDNGLTIEEAATPSGTKDITLNYVTNTNGTKTLTFTFNNLKARLSTLLGDDKIVVKYAATVNESAITGRGTSQTEIANENSVVLQFSNNPQGEGIGQTVEDTAEVYTYELDIVKVDEANRDNKLDGAIFLLGNKFNQTSSVQETGATPGAVVDNEYDYMYPTFAKENGKYVLSGGIVTDVPIRKYSTVTENNVTTYYAEDENGQPIYVKGETQNQLTLTNIMLVSSKTTPIQIVGLDSGNYLLRELKAPDGYNKINSTITVSISAEHNPESGLLTNFKVHALGEYIDGNAENGIVTLTLTNTKGSVLPSTGGIGTTIFYIAGGIMAVAAIVLLITKKRMSDY